MSPGLPDSKAYSTSHLPSFSRYCESVIVYPVTGIAPDALGMWEMASDLILLHTDIQFVEEFSPSSTRHLNYTWDSFQKVRIPGIQFQTQ